MLFDRHQGWFMRGLKKTNIFSMAVEEAPAYRNLGWCSCSRTAAWGAPAAPQLTCPPHICMYGHAAHHAVGWPCWITLTLRGHSLRSSTGYVGTEKQAQGWRRNHAKQTLKDLHPLGAIWQPNQVSSEGQSSCLGALELEKAFILTTTFRKPKLSNKARCTSIKVELSF